jgi:serine/threonine protein kinase
MLRIIVESGPQRGRKFELPEKGTIGIGRDPKCAIQLPDGMVSRLHCVLRCEPSRWRIEDAKSSNHTYVNDVAITHRELAPGDIIQVGETLLSFVAVEVDPLVGAAVGGYRIEARLGRGGMGTVYRAVQISLDRTVALKILAPRFARDVDFVRRFTAEAQAAARLNHPNLVQVYDAGRDGEQHYMSMEFLEGGTLEDLLAREGRLPPPRAVAMAMDAALALTFAERHHIVHRDIKPGNLLLSVADGVEKVKVGDLGIAADLRRAGPSGAREVVGSPRYMAPEQARGEAVDHRADIYALGATLYRSIAGTAPFDAPDIKEILAAKLAREPVPLKEIVPEVSAALSAAVQKMLARRVEERFASAAGAHQALEAALRRPAVRSPRRPLVISPRGGGSVPKLVAGAGVLLVLLFAGITILHRSTSTPPTTVESARGQPVVSALQTPRIPAVREPPAADEALQPGERAAALRQVASLHKSWSDGRIDGLQAEAELSRLLAGSNSPEVRASIERSLAAIRKATSRDRNLAAEEAKRIDEEAGALLEKGELRSAASLVAGFLRRNPQEELLLAPRRRSIGQAASALIEEARPRLESLVAQGDLTGARREVDALELRLPDDSRGAIALLRDQVRRAEEERLQSELALAELARSARAAAAALDFDRARRLIEEEMTAYPAMAPIAAPLLEEVSAAAGAWAQLRDGLEAKRRTGESIRGTFLPRPLRPEAGERRFKVVALAGGTVRVLPAGGKEHETRAVFDLDASALLELCGGAGGGSGGAAPESAARRRGLGYLLLYTGGPEWARDLLLEREEDTTRRGAAAARLESAAGIWLSARLDAAQARRDELHAASAPPPADAWEFVAGEAAQLLVRWRGRPGFEEVRASLRELFSECREEGLLARSQGAGGPPEGIFHARSVKIGADGQIQLAYDFASEEQTKDFIPAKGSLSGLRWVKQKKVVVLAGEVRLLKGNPFRGRIAVSGTVAAFDAAAPNINVAFWTAEDDVVTLGLDGRQFDMRRWRDGNDGQLAADYLAVGMGYRAPFEIEDLAGPGRMGRMARQFQAFLPSYLREAAHVVLAGRKGSSLHIDRRELLWEAPLGTAPRGAVRYSVEMQDEAIRWSFNGRKVPFAADAQQLERLKGKSPRSGSISLFSNGREVYYTAIEVHAQLERTWLESRIRAIVQEELAQLEAAR